LDIITHFFRSVTTGNFDEIVKQSRGGKKWHIIIAQTTEGKMKSRKEK
jgi:hypothetical protein